MGSQDNYQQQLQRRWDQKKQLSSEKLLPSKEPVILDIDPVEKKSIFLYMYIYLHPLIFPSLLTIKFNIYFVPS